jgi:hypothetical protein
MKLEIFDNVLPPDEFNRIRDIMLGSDFPWHYSPGKSYDDEIKENNQIFQFVHMFYHNYCYSSAYGELINPLVKLLDPTALIRIKANLTTITPNKIQYKFHRDTSNLLRSKTAIYYVNTNDGKTIFSTGEEVQSVANRLVIFDSDILHTATSSTNESVRVVINFNYYTKL